MVQHHTSPRTEIVLPGGAVVMLSNQASLAQQRDLVTAIVHATTSGEAAS